MIPDNLVQIQGEWVSGVEWSGEWSGVEWSGVEWSGVEWSVSQSVSVSQLVSQGGHQTYDHNLYIGHYPPSSLGTYKAETGKLNTTYNFVDKSASGMNIYNYWKVTHQVQHFGAMGQYQTDSTPVCEQWNDSIWHWYISVVWCKLNCRWVNVVDQKFKKISEAITSPLQCITYQCLAARLRLTPLLAH